MVGSGRRPGMVGRPLLPGVSISARFEGSEAPSGDFLSAPLAACPFWDKKHMDQRMKDTNQLMAFCCQSVIGAS